MNLSNNTILITGGTSGIGLELVRQFYGYNNKIIVVSGNQSNLDRVRTEFPEIEICFCDLADALSVQRLIEKCLLQYSDINVLINNAAVQYSYEWTAEPDGYKKIEAEIRINFISPAQLIYGLMPILISKSSSAIVNVSSALAFVPKKTAPVYCATKAAVHIQTKALRYQLENSPVKVFEIIPSLVETPMTHGRGTGKISPKQLVDEFLRNFKKDKPESNIGKTKFLRVLHRAFPQIAERILKHS